MVGGDAGLQFRVAGVELEGAVGEFFFRFHVFGIREAALHRAHGLTGFLLVEADALRAQVGVDDVDVVPLGDGVVRALGLAGSAVDAVVGDTCGHRCPPQV